MFIKNFNSINLRTNNQVSESIKKFILIKRINEAAKSK